MEVDHKKHLDINESLYLDDLVSVKQVIMEYNHFQANMI